MTGIPETPRPKAGARFALGGLSVVLLAIGALLTLIGATDYARGDDLSVTALTDDIISPDDLAEELIGGQVIQIGGSAAGSGDIPIWNVSFQALCNTDGFLTCSTPLAYGGLFSGGNDTVGLESGVIMSTGSAANVVPGQVQPAGSSAGPPELAGTPEPDDLQALISESLQQKTLLDFDFMPEGDTLSISFVFSSNEYGRSGKPVGSLASFSTTFNDVMAIFVNHENCALVGDAEPVSVNNINTKSNAAQFFDNSDSQAPDHRNINQSGLSLVLKCAAQVNPGETNHMRVAIGDDGHVRRLEHVPPASSVQRLPGANGNRDAEPDGDHDRTRAKHTRGHTHSDPHPYRAAGGFNTRGYEYRAANRYADRYADANAHANVHHHLHGDELTDGDAHAGADGHGNPYAHAHADGYADARADRNPDQHADRYADQHAYANANAHADEHEDADAHADVNSHGDRDEDANLDSHTHSHADEDANANTHGAAAHEHTDDGAGQHTRARAAATERDAVGRSRRRAGR